MAFSQDRVNRPNPYEIVKSSETLSGQVFSASNPLYSRLQVSEVQPFGSRLYSGTLKGAAIQTKAVPHTAAIRCNTDLGDRWLEYLTLSFK